MGKSFDPIGLVEEMRDAKRCSSTPRPIVSMSFQLAIPWRVALPQSSPPLHQPGASMNERAAAGQQKPANGQLCLNYLSHPRGQVPVHLCVDGPFRSPISPFSPGTLEKQAFRGRGRRSRGSSGPPEPRLSGRFDARKVNRCLANCSLLPDSAQDSRTAVRPLRRAKPSLTA